MASDARKNAETLRAQIQGRIDALEDELYQAQEQLSTVENFLEVLAQYEQLQFDGMANEADEPATPPAPVAKEKPRRRPQNPPREAVVAKAREILAEFGAPLGRAELFSLVEHSGLKIQGKDPQMVFSTMLWREPKKIVRLKEHGYWLADEPFPEAGYVPPGTLG